MPDYQPRIPVKFTNSGGSETLTFPRAEYRLEIEQELRTASAAAIGAHGMYDHLGGGSAPRGAMIVRLSFSALAGTPEDVDDAVSGLLSKAFRFGKGKLYVSGRDSEGTEVVRWTWARARDIPRIQWQAGDIFFKRSNVIFECDPFWHAATETTGTQAISASPQTFTINNPGDLPVYAAVFEIKANAANGFTSPKLLNDTNGHEFTHTRTAANGDSEIKIDTGKSTAEWSTDAGLSYADDYSNFSIGAAQGVWMRLDPGDNSFEYSDSGTPNLSVEWEFEANYAH